MGVRFNKDGNSVDISDGFICISRDDWKSNMCVRVVDFEQFGNLRVSGVFSKREDKFIPTEGDIDVGDFSFLVGEVIAEARLRRVKEILFETGSPSFFRLLKRLKWSTVSASKKTSCYKSLLRNVESCNDDEWVVMRKGM